MSAPPAPSFTPGNPPPPGAAPAPHAAPTAPVAPVAAAATAVACGQCARAFLSPTELPAAVIECPWCGAQARRDTLKASEPRAERPRSGPARVVGWTVLAGVLALGVLGAAAFGLRWFQPTAGRPAPRVAAPPLPDTDPRRIKELVLQEARTAADRALACPDWISAKPFLLDAERIVPMMEKYHARHPWVPVILVGPHQGTLSTAGGVRRVHLSVRSDRGYQLALHLQHTPEGWKLDWERLVNARHFSWQRFLEEGTATPTSLHVLALRGSATEAHFVDAGLTEETGLAVRLDGPRSGLPVLAIVPKASDLGRLFQRELTWEQARPYRCQLRLANPTLVPPRVEITEFEGEGWEP